ncbi:MAG: VOC family protein [Cyclobacteriaceae bacterium]|nr:VOC family protein [Cyclobacteriaceae bacterium HetDA_MAG_MS6]
MIRRVKETCLYIEDIDKTEQFYSRLPGFELITKVAERHVFFRIGPSVLLCFLPEVTKLEQNLPPHFAYGPQHIAFEVDQEDYGEAKNAIESMDISITHTERWGQFESFYFADPSGNVLEIVPKGMWD